MNFSKKAKFVRANTNVVYGSIFCIIIIVFILTSCSGKAKYEKCEGMIWNTLYHVTYQGPENLKDSIMPVLNNVGESLSVFDKNSLVSKLNTLDSVKGDIHLLMVYDTSKEIHRISKGKFDPTVSPLVDAWGFGIGHTPTTDTLLIDSLLQFTGIEKTRHKGEFIVKDDLRTRFNFSAIAKGYGCDAVGEMLRRGGVKNYMVEIGGEIRMSGSGPTGEGWLIAVDAPVEDNAPGETTALIMELTNVGLATSGNYRNYRIENGQKLAHTISPKTGRPVLSEILSATVIASDCMTADGLATACMAGTLQEALNILQESGTEGMFILTDSTVMTPGFKKYVISEVSEPGKTGRN
ncbi:MAG: FAD:protein FMN transferase [Muribaculaceae bacterium]|nr:FAD:protein FMN transferase [Muribaculaceae bacterium]